VTGALSVQIGALAGRSVVRSLRQPGSIVPAIVFPLLFLPLVTGGLRSVTALPGFPTDSYLDFFIAFVFLQGAMFAMLFAGQDLAKDIQTGFLNRLSLTPMRGVSLIAGNLAGSGVLGLGQAIIFLLVGLAAGVTFATGVGGVFVLLALALLIVVAFAAIGTAIALRVGNGEVVQAMFPLFFVLLFLSSMSLPRNLIETDWYREVATYNPVSYMIEALRSLIITGWDAQALALGFACASVILVLGLGASALALRGRLERT
jgi:ABC-2 type transport system permease protein